MGTLLEDIGSGADWIARALQSSGYEADFSGASLWEIDRFFDEQSQEGSPKRGGLLADELGSRLFALGSYVGEVIRRSAGGTWHTNEQSPTGEIDIELALPNGSSIWPVQRVMKRYQNGADEGVAAYGLSLGLDIGQAPQSPSPRKRRWPFRREG